MVARYSLSLMADDLESFVLELDLYTHPIALVGHGLGAAVALKFATMSPRLVGALCLVEMPATGTEGDYLRYHYAQV